ncbi:uncharacterized protein LOC135712249 [Ochlerotatus camptorhynchus]|uniref:uncharacterized protein LOC135712249 n=1 Tax=Ochlerotatus camptorhynchus TaxID=644619 RepID=UPI0031CEA56E
MELLCRSQETLKFYQKLNAFRSGFVSRAEMCKYKDGSLLTNGREASQQANQAVKDAINPTTPPPKSPTDDAVEFNRQKVSLQVPDAVFGSSFSLVTNISTQFGNLIMNSARRAGEFLWIFQPLIGNNLTIEIPTTTTTTARTTTRRATTTSTSTAAMTTTTAATTVSSADTNEIK